MDLVQRFNFFALHNMQTEIVLYFVSEHCSLPAMKEVSRG